MPAREHATHIYQWAEAGDRIEADFDHGATMRIGSMSIFFENADHLNDAIDRLLSCRYLWDVKQKDEELAQIEREREANEPDFDPWEVAEYQQNLDKWGLSDNVLVSD